MDIGGEQYIDVDESRCYCRTYTISTAYIGPVGNVTTEPLSKCDKVIGYAPKVYAEMTTFLEVWRMQLDKHTEANYR